MQLKQLGQRSLKCSELEIGRKKKKAKREGKSKTPKLFHSMGPPMINVNLPHDLVMWLSVLVVLVVVFAMILGCLWHLFVVCVMMPLSSSFFLID